ncbi:unnamed protein product [Cylicocyclus nassatus]|uniref:Uncharacterized protein n=1 Tax=Cylicocyclus nassatus TaxID=53992 RepID=A0AA36M2K9_CYLNA|nr:unnamed protein product [Cylicocyclus nassatus]
MLNIYILPTDDLYKTSAPAIMRRIIPKRKAFVNKLVDIKQICEQRRDYKRKAQSVYKVWGRWISQQDEKISRPAAPTFPFPATFTNYLFGKGHYTVIYDGNSTLIMSKMAYSSFFRIPVTCYQTLGTNDQAMLLPRSRLERSTSLLRD